MSKVVGVGAALLPALLFALANVSLASQSHAADVLNPASYPPSDLPGGVPTSGGLPGLSGSGKGNGFDCDMYPAFCKPPFMCNETSPLMPLSWIVNGVAPAGKPNFQSWCAAKQYYGYASLCAAGEIDTAGKLQADQTIAGQFGPVTAQMDGSYCFLEGLCNLDIDSDTTIEEAAKMCDERVGHTNWTLAMRWDRPMNEKPGWGLTEQIGHNLSNGFRSRAETKPFIIMACAMGNFHCDTRMCKLRYCKDPAFIKKYGHFLTDKPKEPMPPVVV